MEANATQGGQENVEKKGSQPKRSDCDDKVPASSGRVRQVPAGSGRFRKFRQVLASYASSGKFRQVLQVPTMMLIYSIEESGCVFEEAGSTKVPA